MGKGGRGNGCSHYCCEVRPLSLSQRLIPEVAGPQLFPQDGWKKEEDVVLEVYKYLDNGNTYYYSLVLCDWVHPSEIA